MIGSSVLVADWALALALQLPVLNPGGSSVYQGGDMFRLSAVAWKLLPKPCAFHEVLHGPQKRHGWAFSTRLAGSLRDLFLERYMTF